MTQDAESVADWRATMEHPCTCGPRPSTDECPRVEECYEAWSAWRSLAQIKNPRDLLTDEQNAKLNKDLAEMSRQRRRAEAASRDIPLC